jgi:hypothetical protein
MKKFPCRFVLAIVTLAPAFAQISSQTGAIVGTVTDPTGGLVPGAKVTAMSPRGERYVSTTSDTGGFTLPLLAPGPYALTVEKKGFSRAALPEVIVSVTEATSVSIPLTVGEDTISVTVVAIASSVNSVNATLGNVIPGSVVSELPLAARNFTHLLGTNAGVATTIPDASAANRGATVLFVNGQRSTNNNLVINGTDANNLANNNLNTVPVPSPDTIEEFRVQTSMYDASQGKTSGGNINVNTKGGSSGYHGQLYEFFRNEALNANNFMFNKDGQRRPVLRQNQFGGNFGGPVPGLANRTFFFGSYQGTRQTNGASNLVSQFFPVLPQQRTRENLAAAFALNPDAIDPVALALLNHPGQYDGFLVPSGSGAAPGQTGLLTLSAPAKWNEDQFNANGDHLINDRHRLMLRYFQALGTTSDPLGGGAAGMPGSGSSGWVNNYLATVSESWTISPWALNEFRLGFNRIETGLVPVDAAAVGDIGMRRFNSSIVPGIPQFNVAGITFGGPAVGGQQETAASTFHLADVVALTRGRHTVRIGFEGRQYQVNTTNHHAVRGALSYSSLRNMLQGLGQTLATAGSGLPSRDYRARDVSWFVQDDWRIHRRLTLNLGLRYDYLGASVERLNRLGNFDESLLDAETLESGGPGLRRGFILPEGADFGAIQGTSGVSRSTLTTSNRQNFSPRVGLAWDVFGDGRTAVRAGYGVYYVRTSNQTLLQSLITAPFYQVFRGAGTTLANPFPDLALPDQFPIFPPFPSLLGFNAAGQPIRSATLMSMNPIQRNLRTPYSQHWNFTIQRELPGRFALETGYIGSRSVRLLQGILTNQARLANEAGPIRGLTANSALNTEARVAVFGFGPSGFVTSTDNGHSSYHAFVATVSRRMSDFFVLGSYTFSKSIDNNSGNAFVAGGGDLAFSTGNTLVPSLSRGLSDFDQRHRLQVTYNYNAKGFGSGLLKAATGNWNFGGVTTFQSGFPLSFLCLTCNQPNVYGILSALPPDVVGDFSKFVKPGNPREFINSGTGIFNPGIVAPPRLLPNGATFGGNLNSEGGPGNQTYRVGSTGGTTHFAQLVGTLPRNPGPTSPFQQQWDFYAARRFPIGEQVGIVVRGEFFNLFNHAFFAAPFQFVDHPAFGQFFTQQNAPRIIQFAVKVDF